MIDICMLACASRHSHDREVIHIQRCIDRIDEADSSLRSGVETTDAETLKHNEDPDHHPELVPGSPLPGNAHRYGAPMLPCVH